VVSRLDPDGTLSNHARAIRLRVSVNREVATMELRIARALVLCSLFVASAMGSSTAAWAEQTEGFYVFPFGSDWHSVALDANFRVIQTISLPPGEYIANASAALESSTQGQFLLVECVFMLNGAPLGELSRGLIGGGVNNFLTLPLTVGASIDTPQSLQLACRGDFGVRSQPSPITAIRVVKLTTQKGVNPQ
jgi:hypothetical protein